MKAKLQTNLGQLQLLATCPRQNVDSFDWKVF